MIGVDTNILVRYATNDDPDQAAVAVELLSRQEDIFLPKTILLELEWVLRGVYKLRPAVISGAIKQVLGLPNIVPEDPETVALAVGYLDQGFDFADALHLAASHHVRVFYTFDKEFEKKGRSVRTPVVKLKRASLS